MPRAWACRSSTPDGRKTSTGGRTAGTSNLFNGLLFDAPSRTTMVLDGNKTGQVLISSAALRKVPGAQFRAIQYPMFERAVLGALSELKPAGVTGGAGRPHERSSADVTGGATRATERGRIAGRRFAPSRGMIWVPG